MMDTVLVQRSAALGGTAMTRVDTETRLTEMAALWHEVAEIRRHFTSGLVAAAMVAMARLRIADAIADEATPIRSVAAAAGVDESGLFRVLRFLAGHGVVE